MQLPTESGRSLAWIRRLTNGRSLLTSRSFFTKARLALPMANTKSAAKRARQTIKRTLANRRVISAVKTKQRKVRTSIEDGRKDDAVLAARDFVSSIDKAAKTGRVHKNKANRAKSRMAKALAKLN